MASVEKYCFEGSSVQQLNGRPFYSGGVSGARNEQDLNGPVLLEG